MKHAVWFLLPLLCAPAFSQTAPDGNTAAEGAKTHIGSLKLFDPQRPVPIRLPVVFPVVGTKPAVCAIPLLTVKPGPIADRMPVATPPASREPDAQVPAPACDEKQFRDQ
ncbi:MAG: hypothetical protein ABSB15_23895 [Bryobacteraceae bacterium]|jgi:hypothetical protein